MGFVEDIEEMPNQMEYSKLSSTAGTARRKPLSSSSATSTRKRPSTWSRNTSGPWKRGDYKAEIPVEPAPNGPIYEHIQWEVPAQPWVTIGFRGPAFDPRRKDMPAMDLISQVYFSENSDLYQKLVIQEQLVDQLWAVFPGSQGPRPADDRRAPDRSGQC